MHFKKFDEANVKLHILPGVHRDTYMKDEKKKSVISTTKLSPGLFCLY